MYLEKIVESQNASRISKNDSWIVNKIYVIAKGGQVFVYFNLAIVKRARSEVLVASSIIVSVRLRRIGSLIFWVNLITFRAIGDI